MKKYILTALAFVSLSAAFAQPIIKSGYFLNGMPNSHKINPAIMPERGYVGIPFISDISVSAATNMGVGKFLFPMKDGGLTTFMNGAVSADQFLSGLSSRNNVNVDVNLEIFGMGFYSGKSYNTIGINLRSYTGTSLPYSLFDFMKSGMTSANTSYNIENITARTTNFVDIAYGYSRAINSDITVGGKLKFLVGLADVEAKIDHMNVRMSQKEWLVSSRGSMTVAGMGLRFVNGNDNELLSGLKSDGMEIGGFGLGVDIGATYKTPVPGLNVSLALVDLGFISWNNASRASTLADEFRFDGFKDIPIGGVGSGRPIEDQFEDLKDQALDLFRFEAEAGTKSRTTSLRTTLNVGVEYEFFPDKFSVGVLSSTRFSKDLTLSELIVSANYKPKSWFNAALTADISNVAFSWGALINFCPSFINFFAGVDFMLGDITPQFLPVRSGSPRVSIGLSVPLARQRKYYDTLNNRYRSVKKEVLKGCI